VKVVVQPFESREESRERGSGNAMIQMFASLRCRENTVPGQDSEYKRAKPESSDIQPLDY